MGREEKLDRKQGRWCLLREKGKKGEEEGKKGKKRKDNGKGERIVDE